MKQPEIFNKLEEALEDFKKTGFKHPADISIENNSLPNFESSKNSKNLNPLSQTQNSESLIDYYYQDQEKIDSFKWDNEIEDNFMKARKECKKGPVLKKGLDFKYGDVCFQKEIRSMCRKRKDTDYCKELMNKF